MTCLVLDDSVIARERNKKAELLSYIFNHVIGKTVKGFNQLTLGWTDGYSFIPVGFNMMASVKESNRIVPASTSIDKRSNGGKARKILAKGLDVLGMLKDNNQRYIYKSKKYNLKQLGKSASFHKPGNIPLSIQVCTGKQEIPA